MNSRRTKMQIYIDILKTIRKENGRMRKTHIVYKANLTHSRLKEYLDFLISKEFIEEKTIENTSFFVITEKGLKFLNNIDKLRKISDAFGIPL
jgi:predicted transcriptional regulator